MSCDFAVWQTKARLSDAEAVRLYHALCEGDASGVVPSPAIDALYAELTALHPETGDPRRCPWSAAFDRSPGHLVMCCVWPKADDVHDLLRKLAKKHGLALFDPQSEAISYPGDRELPLWRRFWDALRKESPTPTRWYTHVLIGLLFFVNAAFAYWDLDKYARGRGYRPLAALYEMGGAWALIGAPALIGLAFLLLGVRRLGRSKRK